MNCKTLLNLSSMKSKTKTFLLSVFLAGHVPWIISRYWSCSSSFDFGAITSMIGFMQAKFDQTLFCLQVLVKTVPIRQGHKLVFSWPVNPSIHHYKEGPCRYVGHLIGHEGEGSLFSVLKKLGNNCGNYEHQVNLIIFLHL